MQNSDSDSSMEVRLLESSLETLLSSRLQAGTEFASLEGDLALYRDCLIEFHKGDLIGLQNVLDGMPEASTLTALAQIRLGLLKGTLTVESLEVFAARDWPKSDVWDHEPWRSEHALLVASAYLSLDLAERAIPWFEAAARGFASVGAQGKALRAEMNIIVAKSHIHPELRLIPDYFFIYRKAKAAAQTLVAATALLNLSKEYHRMGARRTALKYASKSISVVQDHHGSEIELFARAQRVQLLLELHRVADAAADLEIVCASSLPALQATVKVLEGLFPAAMKATGVTVKPSKSVAISQAPAGWQERLAADYLTGKILSPREESLVRFLAGGGREKFEICDHLFGKDVHPFSAENRLKNLLGRIRSKLPGLIRFQDGRYSLAEPESVEALAGRKAN